MAGIQIYADSEQTVKVFCSADSNKALGIKDGKAAFVDYDCKDQTQEWLKAESGNTAIKGFVLVNKATQKAISQPSVVGQEVVLVDYVPGSFGQLLLWSFSDMGNGFGCICVANNTTLILEVNLSIKLVVRTSAAAPSQLWKISPQFGSVSCKAYSSQALSIKDGNLKLGLADSKDATQQWVKIFKTNSQAFALLNIATSMVCVQPSGLGQKVELANFQGHLEPCLLWKECGDNDSEFRNICVESDTSHIWDVDKCTQSIPVVVQKLAGIEESQLWKITPQIVIVRCKALSDQALGVDNGKLKFVRPDSSDTNQQWVKILTTDHLAFALVNKATWMALRNPSGPGQEVVLVAYKNTLDQNLLWSENDDKGEGYKTINIANNTTLSLEANQICQAIKVVQMSKVPEANQLWKFPLCT